MLEKFAYLLYKLEEEKTTTKREIIMQILPFYYDCVSVCATNPEIFMNKK